MFNYRKIRKSAKAVILSLCMLFCLLACSFNGVFFNETQEIAPVAASYPSSDTPDSIILTMASDPATMQTVNWRTHGENTLGRVRYREISLGNEAPYAEKTAAFRRLETPEITDDPVNSRFTVTLENLKPGTAYEYWVGNGDAGTWTGPYRFTTAPPKGVPFTFMFVGDFQEGLSGTAVILTEVAQKYPETGFYMAAGDFANSGSNRNDWDQMIGEARNVWANYALAPTLGNHDLSGHNSTAPRMYFHYFSLPSNGPADLPPGHAYGFAYGDAYFFVLDSNDKLLVQREWLAQQLQQPEIKQYKWKIVMLHHPVYNIKASRKNMLIHDMFLPVFDEYGVDLVLNGHDHGYMRSKVLYNGAEVKDGQPGTVYVVSNAGGKIYSVEHIRSKAALTIGGMQMYQKIDIDTDDNGNARLNFKAYDAAHNLVDEFTLVK